jgi:predicted TIM-barrel fold metal-dependent hydrolase
MTTMNDQAVQAVEAVQLPTLAPFSAGQGRTKVRVPANACDCHIHVYDAVYAADPGARLKPADATVADYRLLQRRTGTERAVLVTPSTYGTDNRPLLAGLKTMGAQGRGVAVVDERVTDAELQALHLAGVRGVRINLSLGTGTHAAQIQPLAHRIAPWGWHVQLLASPDMLVDCSDLLRHLPVPVVFDHFGRISPSMLGGHPAHALVMDLLAQGLAWVKLSGGYIVTEQGPPTYGDLNALAQSYLKLAPARVVWGSDWPHASATAGHQAIPDDAQQMDLLAQWVGDPILLERVLVDNPADLYGFPLI